MQDNIAILPIDDAVALGGHQAATAILFDEHSTVGEEADDAARKHNGCFKLVRLWVAQVVDLHLSILTVEFPTLNAKQKIIFDGVQHGLRKVACCTILAHYDYSIFSIL